MTIMSERDLEIIDQQIAAARRKSTALGTLISRNTTGAWGTAQQDGSDVPIPVLVDAGTHVIAGDRVRMELTDGRWVVTGGFTRRELGGVTRTWRISGGPYTHNTGSYVDYPENPAPALTKLYDSTGLRMSVDANLYMETAAGAAELALYIDGVDYSVAYYYVNDVMVHRSMSGKAIVAAGVVPAGDHTILVRWRRPLGTGLVRVDTNNRMSFEVIETTSP